MFLFGAGISNHYLINVTISLCSFAGTIPGQFAPEYLGKRLSLLVGCSVMVPFMLIFSSISTGLEPTSPISKNIVIVFLCLWAFVFGALIGPHVRPSSAEMHSHWLRTYGQASTTFLFNNFSFGTTFCMPYMLDPSYGKMGASVGYFYFGVTFVELILVFSFMVETARLTLE